MMLQITAQMATTDEVERDLALVTIAMVERMSSVQVVSMESGRLRIAQVKPAKVIEDSTARAIASWFASPRDDQSVTLLSMGREVEARKVMSDIIRIRHRMTPSERYPLDLLMEWVRAKIREGE